MTRSINYLQQQDSGIYYFRIAVPRRWQKTIGKREIKRSLRTKIKQDAFFQSISLKLLINKFFNQLEDSNSDHINKETMEVFQMMGFKLDKMNINNGVITFEGLEIDSSNIEAEKKAFDKVFGSAVAAAQPQKIQNHSISANQHGSMSLSSIIEDYIREKVRERSWKTKTEIDNRANLKLLAQIIGDLDIGNIDYSHSRKFKETLMQLPVNINKDPLYRDKSIETIIAMKPTNTMAINTINKHLTLASALFKWATTHGYCNKNVFENLNLKKTVRAHQERCAFDKSDLEKIFNGDQYKSYRYTHPYYYWLPLLGYLTGARLEEICQLHLSDIKQEDDIWIFDINDRNNKNIKTEAGCRAVPVHQKLIELGLLDYISELNRRNEKRLFPELKKQRDGYSQAASKWFGRYRKRIGVTEAGKVFHSFRHTVIDNLKQNEFNKHQIAALVGHADDSVTFNRYGKPYKATVLKKLIESIDVSVVENINKYYP